MARTDENGKGLQAVLGYELDRAVPVTEIYDALGIARSTYHRRAEEGTYPNAEELRLIAESFGLNPLDLMLRFGLVTETHLERALAERKPGRLPKISAMLRNPDVPPL